ncbi:MobF family relaxase [Nonomuraea sp. NPDC050663]|uniref:MobF family relaxase n=1 Tax=Nonomuraea sp. NPDC050663 TaxID=3364370 RepID=UPI003791C6E5
MAWVSVIGPSMEQVDYRLQEGAGCGMASPGEHGHADPGGQIAYRLADERGLMWVGEGLHELCLTPGTRLTPDQHEAARAIMSGVDPRSGEVLVAAKHVSDPRAKLPGAPLLAALQSAAADQHLTVPQLLAGYAKASQRAIQLARGVARERMAYTIRIQDAEQLAHAAGIDLVQVYEADALAYADKWRDAKVRVGNRGYDLTLDVSKSVSVLYGLADRSLAAEIEQVFAEAVSETVTAMESWAGYGLRGHQGDGKLAERMDATGLLGWVMWHKTARPVDGAAPDPHLHAHVTIANMVKGHDGRWSAVGAGGRDIHRHAHAADALLKARLRRRLTQQFGITWAREKRTGAWEIASIPEQVRLLFSKRSGQLRAQLTALGIDPETASRQAQKTAAAESRQAKDGEADTADLPGEWHRQVDQAAGEHGYGLRVVADCLPRPDDGAGPAAGAPWGPQLPPRLPPRPSVAEIAEWIWRPEDGLTAHTKLVSRADVLAAVIDACPDGVSDLADAEALTDAVLALRPAVLHDAQRASHLSNAQQYTSDDIMQAERTLLRITRERYNAAMAVVDPEAAALAIDAYQVSGGFTFSRWQKAVLDRLLAGDHGVEAVIGVAGSGKTTMMAAGRAAWESRGLVVAGAANAAVAAVNLQAESGITSSTIARWLRRIRTGRGLAGVDVLVVDEAAMADDRHLAELLTESVRTGTKVVLIGDPVQLNAAGVGGGFAAIHRQVDGLKLTENRRQSDPVERKALKLWRKAAESEGEQREQLRRQAMHTWGDGERVRLGQDSDDTLTRLLADWAAARQPYQNVGQPTGRDAGPDGSRDTSRDGVPPETVHDELAQVLLLAGTNDAVDRLNAVARAMRRQAGELPGRDELYRLPAGRLIALTVGDHVRVRRNDYRSRRGRGTDVLNGFRGVITAIDVERRVEVEWRQAGPDGPRLVREWITPDFIATEGLSYGTALTVAAAQGLTADHALIYGLGLDPHTLYAAMTRDRLTARLYLPQDLVETDVDRISRGRTDSMEERLARVLAAYAKTLEGDRADKLLTPQPEPIAHQLADEQPPEPTREPFERAVAPVAERAEADHHDEAASRPAQPEPQQPAPQKIDHQDAPVAEALAAIRQSAALLALSQTPFGVGLYSDAELDQRRIDLSAALSSAADDLAAVRAQARRYAEHGGGPAERALQQRRADLAEYGQQIRMAQQAADALGRARQEIADLNDRIQETRRRVQTIDRTFNTLGRILPSHRSHRRALEDEATRLADKEAHLRAQLADRHQDRPILQEQARQAAEQAPPMATWPHLLNQREELERDWERASRGARSTDVSRTASHAETIQQSHLTNERELAAVQEEATRRADLPPDTRTIEAAAREAHAARADRVTDREERGKARTSRSRDRDEPVRSPAGHEPELGHEPSRQ